MDDLDLLKKDWKKQEQHLPHLTYNEIYKMIWKRSHSIVKWIFIISIIEFFLGAILNVILSDKEYWAQMERYGLTDFIISFYIISYLVTFYFIYKFYRNYRTINATDSASILMKNILKTRKTVKHYIGFILISSGVVFVITLILMIRNHAVTSEPTERNMEFDAKQWLIFIGGSLLALAILLGVIWLIYRVIYGILLKRLHKNYKELKKLEME